VPDTRAERKPVVSTSSRTLGAASGSGRVAHRFPLPGLARILAALARARRARHAAEELEGLDDRMLRDIGLDRGAARLATRSDPLGR
jgi:uncharacterized protein YjiS (DUF1127 family)